MSTQTLTLVCQTTDESGAFGFALLKLDEDMVVYLLHCRAMFRSIECQEEELYCLEIFERTAQFGDDLDAVLPLGLGDWYSVRSDTSLSQPAKYDCGTLKVTSTGVLWSAYPKHGDGYFETPEIVWDDLQTVLSGRNPFTEASSC